MSEQTIEVSEKLAKIMESIETLTVLELSELVKALEEKFGVSAAAPVAMVAGVAGGAAGAAAAEEKTEFDVILASQGDKKIQVIKVVRELTGLGLKEAKEMVDKVPSTVKSAVSKEDADSMKEKLEAVGATIEIK